MMGPQETMEILGNAPDIQYCFIQALLLLLGGSGAAATGAAATGAAATGAAATGAAATGAAAGAAATGATTTTTALSAFTDIAAGISEVAPAAETIPAAAGATPTSVPTTPPAVSGAALTPAPVVGSGAPAGGTSPTSFPTSTLTPPAPSGPAPPGLLAPLSPTPSSMDPGLLARISKFLVDFPETEVGQIIQGVRDLGNKAPVKRAQVRGSAPGLDQQTPPTEGTQIPQLNRAQTVSSPIGLDLASKSDEVPLTFEEIKGLQQNGILELISQLRTQRRTFG